MANISIRNEKKIKNKRETVNYDQRERKFTIHLKYKRRHNCRDNDCYNFSIVSI